MPKKKTSQSIGAWAQKAKVKLKILAPVGVTLTPSETVVLAGMYEEDVATIEKNEKELSKAIRAAESSLSIGNTLKTARGARAQAVSTYKITKDPIKKREWARRIVVADQTIQSVRDVKTRLTATKDRLTMIRGDMELQLIEAEAKAAEMEAYAAAGKSLRLVGEKLIQARSRANTLALEYSNLEVTMEGAEKMASGLTHDELAKKAEAIIERGSEDEKE